MRPEVDFAGRAIQGDRDNQEDFYAFEPLGKSRLLLVLADGAGGQAKGEAASRSAALGFLDCFGAARGKELPTLSTALDSANQRLAEFIDRDPTHRASMATTLLAVLVNGTSFNWISVGDSPLILFREARRSGSTPIIPAPEFRATSSCRKTCCSPRWWAAASRRSTGGGSLIPWSKTMSSSRPATGSGR